MLEEELVCQRCSQPGTFYSWKNRTVVLCRECIRHLEHEQDNLVQEFLGIPKVEQGMKLILDGLHEAFGLDVTDENFRDTPQRVARAYVEIFQGIKDTEAQVVQILSTSFPAKIGEMIIVRDIKAFSMCPHHFLPVEYKIIVSYVSSGVVLGLSKLARLAEVLARRPVLQEQFTEDLADRLFQGVNANGVGVWVEGIHYCMRMRGARQAEATTITSAIRGCFEKPEVREEFLNLTVHGRSV
jgi:GTP cyclohydrolase I